VNKHLEERLVMGLMIASMVIVIGSLFLILGTVIVKGLPALNLGMLTQVPKGGYYLGKEGGILNAIAGSLALAGGATALSFVLGLGVALYLQLFVCKSSRFAHLVRLSLDVLWGVPSIVYGAFGFTLLLLFKMRASLLGGIITLALLELPVMVRGMEEVMAMVPFGLKEASYAFGAVCPGAPGSAGHCDCDAARFRARHRRRSLGALHRRLHRSHARVSATTRGVAAAGGVLPVGYAAARSAAAGIRRRPGVGDDHSHHQLGYPSAGSLPGPVCGSIERMG
jgi:hypothetical protein